METEKKIIQKVIGKSRSAAYPVINLEEAVVEIKKLRTNHGKGPYNRLTLAQGLEYKSVSGPAASKIATLIQYGLIEKASGNYKLSNLADNILFPSGEGDESVFLKEALRNPRLYSALIDNYNGHEVPLKLQNILITQFKIRDNVAGSVAEDFRKSMEYAGVLHDGVIKIDDTSIEHEAAKSGIESPEFSCIGTPIESARNEFQSKKTLANAGREMYPVELPSGIIIFFPAAMSYNFALGNFAEGIKVIEKCAQEILSKTQDETETIASRE